MNKVDHTDGVPAKGTLMLELQRPDGTVERREVNLIVALGKAHFASRLMGVAQAVMGWMAIGTGAVAAAAANTALGAEVARGVTAVTNITTTVANDTVQYVTTFAPGVGTGAITEAALLNAASVGTLLSRSVFGVITKGALDTLTITWKIQFT
jgi:hypothetical protein